MPGLHTHTEEGAVYQRHGTGHQTPEVMSTKVPEEVAEAFIAWARRLGQSPSDLMRKILWEELIAEAERDDRAVPSAFPEKRSGAGSSSSWPRARPWPAAGEPVRGPAP